MRAKLSKNLNSLPVQMIASFVGLALLTAIASGLPAMWLLRDQLEQQAWSQVGQGRRAVQALYTAKQTEVDNLATLTAQRPTLRRLLTEGEPDTLAAYLTTLQEGAGLDFLLVCAPDRAPLVQVGLAVTGNLCEIGDSAAFLPLTTTEQTTGPALWLVAGHAISDDGTGPAGRVIVGELLNDAFATQMQNRTGLEHTLLNDNQPLATSLAGGVIGWQEITGREQLTGQAPIIPQTTFQLAGRPYYATEIPLDALGLVLAEPAGRLLIEIALDVSQMSAAQQRQARTLLGSIIVIAGLGSVLGVFLARRVSQPLARLTQAASQLSQGNLDKPITANTRVREVALVGWALEAARVDLKLTLNDLQREKAWTDHLLEAIIEGIMTLDRQGQITFFSRGAERITGWNREQVLGRSCDELFQPMETREPFSRLLPGLGRRHNIAVALADGRQAVLSFTGAKLLPLEEGGSQMALVFRDVSEEEAVHRLMGHFLANVAHEFRTPLSALAASVELLLDQAPDLSPAELQELLGALHLGVVGLQTLVDNLLEGASIEAGRFRVYTRPTDLLEIVSEALRSMQPLLTRRGQRLDLNMPATLPPVRADARRTIQVLINLLANASKYSPDDTDITVGATVAGEMVRLTMADRGPGIPATQRVDLFRRFGYPHAASGGSKEGVGLGLSVVKAIVEAQGGQVGVDDHPGGGSIFWFTVPLEGEQ